MVSSPQFVSKQIYVSTRFLRSQPGQGGESLLSFYFFVFFFIFIFWKTSSVFAQGTPPSGAGPEVIEMKAKEKAEKETAPTAPVPLPETIRPEERPQPEVPFYIEKINVEGNTIIPQAELDLFLKKFEGREVTYSELKQACHLIEEMAYRRGYLSYCNIPPQKIENKEVTLKLIVARMGALHIEGARYSREKKLKSYWTIPFGTPLRYNQMQAALAQLNSNPDRVVRSILRPGQAPETSDVYLKVEDHFPIHVSASYDNESIKLFDKKRAGFNLRHNNLLGLDDIFVVGATVGKDFSALYSQYLLPITNFGTKLLVNASGAKVDPKKEFASLGIKGTSQTYGVSFLQNVLRTDRFSFDLSTGLTAKEKKTRTLNVATVKDSLREFSLGGNIQTFDDESGRLKIGEDLCYGKAVHPKTELLSRQADFSFFKYNYSLERFQHLAYQTNGMFRINGQLSGDKLTPEEEVFLGGASTVRGFPESDYGADKALIANLEYWVPFFFIPEDWTWPGVHERIRNQINLFGFFDYGWGRLNQPSTTEVASRTMEGAGAGISINFGKDASGRIQWGVPIGGTRPLTEHSKHQIYFDFRVDY